MDDTFKIFVHRLKGGHEEKIEEALDPQFLEVNEEGLAFTHKVYLQGHAELADGMFILKFSIKTETAMPCAICNKEVVIPITIPDFYYMEPLAEIRGGVFDYREILREAILLEIPYTAECNKGDCPERATVAKYLSKGD